jgi:hypothetical protein
MNLFYGILARIEDQETVDLWLTIISISFVVLVVALVVFTLCIRIIARRMTRPCHWCTEFIPKTEKICPKCGKAVS